jgi:hypothetical protein
MKKLILWRHYNVCKNEGMEKNKKYNKRTHIIQVKVFWVVLPCSVVARNNVSDNHAASIFRVK